MNNSRPKLKKTEKKIEYDNRPVRYRCDYSSTPLKVLQARGWTRVRLPLLTTLPRQTLFYRPSIKRGFLKNYLIPSLRPRTDKRRQGPGMGPVVVRHERAQARPGRPAAAPAEGGALP